MSKQYIANSCIDNPDHQMFRITDGARCVDCNGLVNIRIISADKYYGLPTYQQLLEKRKQIKSNNEIEIIMSNPNKPPKIKLNGKSIKGIIELRYSYDTDTEVPNGQHNYTVKYCDEDTNAIRTISVNKIWEGEDE